MSEELIQFIGTVKFDLEGYIEDYKARAARKPTNENFLKLAEKYQRILKELDELFDVKPSA